MTNEEAYNKATKQCSDRGCNSCPVGDDFRPEMMYPGCLRALAEKIMEEEG